MKIDLSHYGNPLLNNSEHEFFEIEIKNIKKIEINIDLVTILYRDGGFTRFRFFNKRFSDLFIRRLKNGY